MHAKCTHQPPVEPLTPARQRPGTASHMHIMSSYDQAQPARMLDIDYESKIC